MTVAYNVYRFGDPLEFGYRPPVDPGFTTPLLEGASGLLFDAEKSLVLFAPALVLVPFAFVTLWRRARVTAALLLALFAVTFVLAATWHSWQGGWSWGPRLVIPGVALVLVALGAVDRHEPAADAAGRGAVRAGLRGVVLGRPRAAGNAAHRSRSRGPSGRRSCASTASCRG